MKVIITFTFCCDNLGRSKFIVQEKLGKLGEFFLILRGHPESACTYVYKQFLKYVCRLAVVCWTCWLVQGVRRISVSGMVHSGVYLNKYVVSIAPFSIPACPDCSQNIQKTAFFACFRFIIFRPFSRWVSWPHLSLCADAHGLVCCGCAESSSTRRSSGRRRSSSCWPISSGASPGSHRSLPTNSLVRDGVLPSVIGMPTLAQFRFSGLAIASAEIQIKYTEAILSNSTRKLLRFEIIRMLVALKK